MSRWLCFKSQGNVEEHGVHMSKATSLQSKSLGTHSVLQGNGLQTHLGKCPLNKSITNQNKSLKNGKKSEEWEE